MAATGNSKRILLVSTDKAFLQDTKAAFASSEKIELVVVEKNVGDLRAEIQEADCGAVIIDMDADPDARSPHVLRDWPRLDEP